jgi:hypothetical protein
MSQPLEITETVERSEAMDYMRERALLTCRAVERGWLSPEEVKAAKEGLVDFLWYLKSSYNERDMLLRKLLKDEEELPNGLPSPISDLKDGGQGPSKTHMLLYLVAKVPGLTNEGYAAIMNPSILNMDRSHRGRRAFISSISGASAQLRLDPGNKTTSKDLLEKTPDTANKTKFFRTRVRPEALRGGAPFLPDPLLFPGSRDESVAPELPPVPEEEPPPPVPREPREVRDHLTHAFRDVATAMGGKAPMPPPRHPVMDIDAILNSVTEHDPEPTVDGLLDSLNDDMPVVRTEPTIEVVNAPFQGAVADALKSPTGQLIEKRKAARDALASDLEQIKMMVRDAESEVRTLRAKRDRLIAEIQEEDTIIAALSSYNPEAK